MTFDFWEEGVPESITAGSLWKMKAYRPALFASDVRWRDVKKIARKRTMRSLADHRLSLMTDIIKLLLTMGPQQRGQQIREPTEAYKANGREPVSNALLEVISFSD